MKKELITHEEVQFSFSNKGINGILTRLNSVEPSPAIILLQGSDRSSAEDPYYAEHAQNLVQAGFVVLRYDGKGRGGTSNESEFETLEYRTEEAIAAVKYMQSRPDIKSSAVGLWGISQGGWICQMAAASYDGVAFIVPVSGPGVTPAEQEVYRVEAMSRAAGFDNDDIARAVLMRRLMVDIVLNEPIFQNENELDSIRLGEGPWSELTKLAYLSQPLDLVVEFAKVVEIFSGTKDESWAKFLHLDQVLSVFNNLPPQAWGMVKTQMRAVMDVDPSRYLKKVHCPVLAIFGEKDTSVPVEKSISIYRQYLAEAGNKDFTYKVFPKASHTIRIDEIFAEGYFDLMRDWLIGLKFG